MKLKILLAAALTLLATSFTAWASEIVNAAYVAEAAKRGAIIWDVRSPGDYAKGHVLGAINIGNAGNLLRNPNTEDFIATAEVQKLFNAAGLDLTKEVIVYARAGDPYAYWGLTAVKYFGGKNGKVFHGGLDEWQAAGQPLAKEPTRLAAVEQTLKVDPSVQVMLPEVIAKVGRADVQFIDARTPKEFSGDDVRALRGGHIPGAKNIPYEQNWTDPATAGKLARGEVKTRDGMALKSPEQLKAMYASLDPNKETIVYCQSGVRASETAAVMRSLGFNNVRVFEESWLGYGNNFAAPAEAVQFVNVGALNSKIKNLEGEVEALNAEVEALKAAKK
jgi:thiosulfate/3-mercaptopyruvate sulfurtransferase